MTTEEARLDFGPDADTKDPIERAAKLASESTSTFVVHATVVRTDQLLAHTDVTIVPAEEFDELLASLDIADEASPLARLGHGEHRYVRK